jgi:hypothetical protein
MNVMAQANDNSHEVVGEATSGPPPPCVTLLALVKDERYHLQLSDIIFQGFEAWFPNRAASLRPEAELLASLMHNYYTLKPTTIISEVPAQTFAMDFLGLTFEQDSRLPFSTPGKGPSPQYLQTFLWIQMLLRYSIQKAKQLDEEKINIDLEGGEHAENTSEPDSMPAAHEKLRGASRRHIFEQQRQKLLAQANAADNAINDSTPLLLESVEKTENASTRFPPLLEPDPISGKAKGARKSIAPSAKRKDQMQVILFLSRLKLRIRRLCLIGLKVRDVLLHLFGPGKQQKC